MAKITEGILPVVTENQALELYKLGIGELCSIWKYIKSNMPAPTYHYVVNWFKKKGVDISVDIYDKAKNTFSISVSQKGRIEFMDAGRVTEEDLAYSVAIDYAILICKENKSSFYKTIIP